MTGNGPLDTAVDELSGEATAGSFYLANSQDLAIVAPGVTAGGEINISAEGELSVDADVSAQSDVTLTTIDAAAAGQNLIVSSGVAVESVAGDLELIAGDDVDVDGDLTAAAGAVAIHVDQTMTDPDVGVGSTVDIDAASVITTANGATIDGGDDNDSFSLAPQDTTSFEVGGNPPVFGDAGVPPGDTLNLDLANIAVGNAVLTLGMNPGDGSFQFLSPETEMPVTYTSIETVTELSGGPYHLVVDMRLAGFENGVGDQIDAQLDASGVNLEIGINGMSFFQGDASDILSLTVIGSDDRDVFTINESAGGLPSFSGQAPMVDNTGIGGGVSNGAHLNDSAKFQLDNDYSNAPFTASNVSIHFDGAVGNDELSVELTTMHDAAYFSDTVDSANSGNVYTANSATAPDLLLSFASLAPLNFVGAGGDLLVDATSTPATSTLTLEAGPDASDGVSLIAGDGGFETTLFSGFDGLIVRGGEGNEFIDLVSLDNLTTTTAVTLDGDNVTDDDDSEDLLQVRSTPAGVNVTLAGRPWRRHFLAV